MFLLTIKKWNAPPSTVIASPEKANLGATARDTLRLPILWISMLAFFFYTGSEAGAGQVTSNLFTEGRAVDPQVVGYWITFYWASFTIGRFLFGMIIDRYDARMVLRLAIFGAAVGAGLLCLNLSNTVSFWGLALMGFTLAPVFPTLMSQTPSRVGQRHAANAIGFQGAAAGMGVSLLLALAGRLAETLGVEVLDLFLLVVTVGTFVFHEIILYRESRRILIPMEF
jgi:fucose permease